MEIRIRDRPFNRGHHPFRGIRCLGAQIRATPHNAPVNLSGSFVLGRPHRSPLQLHVLQHIHLVSRRLAATSPPLVRSLDIDRSYTHCDLRSFRRLPCSMAYSTTSSSMDIGNRRSCGACRPTYPRDDAGATVLLAIRVSGHRHPIFLSRLHLHRRCYHREQQREEE